MTGSNVADQPSSSFKPIIFKKTAVGKALGDLPSLSEGVVDPSSACSSNTKTTVRLKDLIAKDGFLITGTRRYSHQVAHIIDSCRGDKGKKDVVVCSLTLRHRSELNDDTKLI